MERIEGGSDASTIVGQYMSVSAHLSACVRKEDFQNTCRKIC